MSELAGLVGISGFDPTLVSGELAGVVSLLAGIGAHGESLVAGLTAGVGNVKVVDGRALSVVTKGCCVLSAKSWTFSRLVN